MKLSNLTGALIASEIAIKKGANFVRHIVMLIIICLLIFWN